MKKLIPAFLIMCCTVVGVFAQAKNVTSQDRENATAQFVQPTQKGVGIYTNETRKVNEEATLIVGVDDRLQIVKTGRTSYFVKTDAGKTGWVEKRLVAMTSGKKFVFNDAEIVGYLDNPTPVYIMDADNKDATPIKLERSFSEALRQNTDRETIERQSK
jgi:hypothetical protein